MTINEYKEAVKKLFRSGTATHSQWEEMATAVLSASEGGDGGARNIDKVVLPEQDFEDAYGPD